tara:strand:- start:268 stop:1620 length:1353 start_codon:yes stop_codon:yes gene_type:complete
MALITQSEQAYYSGNNFGGYQFVSLTDIIDNFMATYVGKGKILTDVQRPDVSFHAHRAVQELSFDTFKSFKTQEIELPPSLTMVLPQDYVNYVKLTWSDASGVEHVIYPASKTSNPKPILQNSDGDYALTATGTLTLGSATVTLDAEYSNVLVGMQVSSPSIPVGTLVASTANASSITTITLEDAAGVAVNATWGAGTATNSQEVLTFTPTDDSLVLQEESSFIVETLDWNTTDPKIAANTAADISSIEVGMLVSHDSFPVGTTVLDVNGIYITTSAVATAIPAGGANTGEVTFLSDTKISDTWGKYKSSTPSENNQDDYEDDTYWSWRGERYGLDPQHAQVNGSFFIDLEEGKIHFSSNISGKTVILEYISDGLGTDAEMQVHKFAEEAMYKWIAHGCLTARLGIPEYVINRFKKEKFAETRKAKLRLSNIKLEEITQILRGKSKQIKH